MIIKKVFLFSLSVISIYLAVLAIDWWRAELIYPVQKSIMFSSYRGKIPQLDNIENLEQASLVSPFNAEYEILKGKFFTYKLALNETRERRKKDDLSRGKESFLKALLLNPVYLENLAHLGWIDFAQGDSKEGSIKFEQAVKLSPQNYFVHLLYGIAIMNFLNVFTAPEKNNYLEKVHSEISEAINLNPSVVYDLSVINALAKYYLYKKDWASAIHELEKIRIFDAQTLPLHAKLASLYIKNGKSLQGIRKYSQLLEILNEGNRNENPRSTKLILAMKKKYKKIFLSAMIRDANENFLDSTARLFLGKIYFKEKLYEKALHEMNLLIKQKDTLYMAYYIHGLANEALGNEKAAYMDYESSLRYNSNYDGAATRLKELLKRGISP